MKKSLALVVTLLVIGSVVFAQEQLINPGITPDNPLYVLDRAIERLQLILTFDEESKAKLHLMIAEERLSEAKAMVEKGKPEFVEDLAKEYEVELNECNRVASKAQEVGKDVTKVRELVVLATSKHLEVLEEVQGKVPGVAKPAIERAMDVSVRGQEEALDRLGENLPEMSAKLYFELAEKRLLKAREKVREGKLDKVEELIREFERKINKSQEMIEKAEITGRNVTEIVEIVSIATSTHLEVLQEVKERLPEEAQEAIERAMDVSVRGQEEALKALQKTKPERVEEIKAEIPEEIKQIREEMGRLEEIVQPEVPETPTRPR